MISERESQILLIADYISNIIFYNKECLENNFVYGNYRRAELHYEICETLNVEREKTLEITNNLEKFISVDYNDYLELDEFNEEKLFVNATKILDLILKTKEVRE